MATAKAVMDTAASYIGTTEAPRNSNNVIFNTHYYGRDVHDGLWGCYFPWCCAYVWDIFRLAGASSIFNNGGKTASCKSVYEWGKKNGLLVNKKDGRYGDLVIFDWGRDGDPDHIGFIEKRNQNGTYTTIEGNTADGNDSNGGEVMRRTRYESDIIYIVRPKYEDTEDDEEVRYTKISDVPTWYKSTLDKLIANGFLNGKGGEGEDTVIDLSEDSCRVLTIMDRAGSFNKEA